MSKADAQRAMREAKWAQQSAGGASRPKATVTDAPTAPAVRLPATKPARVTEPVVSAGADGERCGHKSMNGRACTREVGHAEKSHRYS